MNPIHPIKATATIQISQDELEAPGAEARMSKELSAALSTALGQELLDKLQLQVLRSKQSDRGKIQFSISCVAMTAPDYESLVEAIQELVVEDPEQEQELE